MGAIATFDYAQWTARYPEFTSSVSAPLAASYFTEAGLYLNNVGAGPVPDMATQQLLLNMLVAHIAFLNAPLNGVPSPTLVGRINNASEGSVSVGIENLYPPGSPQWFQQTKYGAAFWAASVRFRTMRYIPPVANCAARGFGFFRR